MTYLISIAVGPVQDFIASARRSRDLWFGSWLLSEISKAAANKIANGDKDRLIFPAINDLDDLKSDSDFNVVNKLTAIIKIEKGDVQKFAEDVQEAAKGRLSSLRNDAFKRFKSDEYFDSISAIAQIEDLLEFYWAAVPLPDENSYSTVRRQAEALLTARKNTRNFTSTKGWAMSGVPKSSLDGLRESVIKKEAYDELTDEDRRRLFETRPGERLCGVGLLKRLGNRKGEAGFFSTSHVAALPLLSNLREADRNAVAQYFEKLKGIDNSAWSRVSGNGSSPVHQSIENIFKKKEGHPCDGRLLFEDRFTEYVEKKNRSSEERKKKIDAAKIALRDFLKAVFGENRKPNPYYALLLADGDGMGKEIEKQTTPDQHQELSGKLSQFAKGVRTIVETNHHGSLIYAGGDDILAFLPVHQVVQCAKALSDDFKATLNTGPTLSIGVAICHHLDPLSDALTLAREAEKEAKRLPDKNALCVKLDKRGGETTTVVDHWGKLDERLKIFTLLFAGDKLPDGVAYEFQKLAHQLKLEPRAIPGEVKRILKRKRAGHGGEVLDRKVAIRLQQDLNDLEAAKPKDGSLARLAEELIVARALAAAHEQSFPSQKAAMQDAQNQLELILKDIKVDDGGDNANLVDRTA